MGVGCVAGFSSDLREGFGVSFTLNVGNGRLNGGVETFGDVCD